MLAVGGPNRSTFTHTHTTVALIQHTLEPHQPHAHYKGRMVGTWSRGGDSLTRGRPAEGSSSGSKNNSGSNSSRRPQAYWPTRERMQRYKNLSHRNASDEHQENWEGNKTLLAPPFSWIHIYCITTSFHLLTFDFIMRVYKSSLRILRKGPTTWPAVSASQADPARLQLQGVAVDCSRRLVGCCVCSRLVVRGLTRHQWWFSEIQC